MPFIRHAWALNSDHMQGFDPDKSLNPFNPFLAWQVAIERKTEGGQVFGAGQRISREEALRLLTRDAAYLSYDEGRKRSIEVGKLGDCTVLTADPLTCPVEELHWKRAAATIVGGNVVTYLDSPSRAARTYLDSPSRAVRSYLDSLSRAART